MKRPQPNGEKITLVSDNKISKAWAFSFQNMAKWDERKTDQLKFTTDHSILFTKGHSDHTLSTLISKAAEAKSVTLELRWHHSIVEYIRCYVIITRFRIAINFLENNHGQKSLFLLALNPSGIFPKIPKSYWRTLWHTSKHKSF